VSRMVPGRQYSDPLGRGGSFIRLGHTVRVHDRRLSWSEMRRRKADARTLTATSGNVCSICKTHAPGDDHYVELYIMVMNRPSRTSASGSGCHFCIGWRWQRRRLGESL